MDIIAIAVCLSLGPASTLARDGSIGTFKATTTASPVIIQAIPTRKDAASIRPDKVAITITTEKYQDSISGVVTTLSGVSAQKGRPGSTGAGNTLSTRIVDVTTAPRTTVQAAEAESTAHSKFSFSTTGPVLLTTVEQDILANEPNISTVSPLTEMQTTAISIPDSPKETVTIATPVVSITPTEQDNVTSTVDTMTSSTLPSTVTFVSTNPTEPDIVTSSEDTAFNVTDGDNFTSEQHHVQTSTVDVTTERLNDVTHSTTLVYNVSVKILEPMYDTNVSQTSVSDTETVTAMDFGNSTETTPGVSMVTSVMESYNDTFVTLVTDINVTTIQYNNVSDGAEIINVTPHSEQNYTDHVTASVVSPDTTTYVVTDTSTAAVLDYADHSQADYDATVPVIMGKTSPMTTKAAEPEPTDGEIIEQKPPEKPLKEEESEYSKETPRKVDDATISPTTLPWEPHMFVTMVLKVSLEEVCSKIKSLQSTIATLMTSQDNKAVDVKVDTTQVVVNAECEASNSIKKGGMGRLKEGSAKSDKNGAGIHMEREKGGRVRRGIDEFEIQVYLDDKKGHYSYHLTQQLIDLLAAQKLLAFKGSAWDGLIIDIKFHGSKTRDSLMMEPKSPWHPTVGILIAIVIGAIAGIILLAFIILQLVILKRRRRVKTMRHSYENRHSVDTLQGLNMENIQLTGLRMDTTHWGYANPALVIDDKDYSSNPMNFTELTKFIKDPTSIEEEFLMLPNYVAKMSDIPTGAEDKNRYANVIPVPETRVLLRSSGSGDAAAEYINANYVRGYLCAPCCYIATQAPMENTVEDFWRMIYEQKAQVILMLTSLEEHGSSRCEEYWPNTDGGDITRRFGEFEITLVKRDIRREWITSALKVTHAKEPKQPLRVDHFWLTSWPGSTVPDPRTVIGYLLSARQYMERSLGPTVVHCSPGTGRTGVLLAADIQMLAYDDAKIVDVLSCVCDLRQDRVGLIQNKEQYKLLYKAIFEYAQAVQNTSRNPSRASSYSSVQTAR